MARVAQFTVALPVYVRPPVKAEIRRRAEESQVSMAEIIRELLDRALADHQNPEA